MAPSVSNAAEQSHSERKSSPSLSKDPKQDYSINFAKVHEGKRVFTIAYRMIPERPTMNIEYAASVFRKDNEKETYNRRKHVQTARGRLTVRPLYTTFDFSKEMIDNILEKEVPKSKEERRDWSTTTQGQQWKDLRREMDEQIAAFLRREISKHGVGAKDRLRRSEVDRRRSCNPGDRKVAEITSLLAALGKNGANDRQAIEKVISMGSRQNGNRTRDMRDMRDDAHEMRA